ncbi:hypothetical protein J7E32_03390 [Bacillus sp. ISL-55]|nr:hypothetical protein [Bacillus sp. ISL-55]
MFGQLSSCSSKSCPKYGQVRTTFQLLKQKLSEVRPSSDNFSATQAKAVRSKAKFGQLSGQANKSCPKQGQVRTTFRPLKRKLSKVGAGSDKIPATQAEIV